jgi:hypothetical protein
MLKEGLDVYVPLVDDDAIDAVIRRADGSFVTVQIKARSSDVIEGDGALFAAITTELRENYWFVFYSELMNSTWIMSSQEFISEAVQNKSGKNAGKRSIWFNGKRKDRVTGRMIEACKPQFEKYDFSANPVSVFSGNFEVVTRFKAPPTASPGMAFMNGKLRYQACNNKECLPPRLATLFQTRSCFHLSSLEALPQMTRESRRRRLQ